MEIASLQDEDGGEASVMVLPMGRGRNPATPDSDVDRLLAMAAAEAREVPFVW